MPQEKSKVPAQSSRAEIDEFLEKVARTPVVKAADERGRLVFAIDATASREPTWDMACHLQAEMFDATASLGGLDIQLVWYRGFRQFGATPWLSNANDLVRKMTSVRCLGGHTQIGRVLRHTIKETRAKRVDALVFVGDCVEERVDTLSHFAGELGLLGVPAFMFHEGLDPVAQSAFRQIARLSGGAYCSFDAGSARQLRELLSAVAVYAAGGRRALEDLSKKKGGALLQITQQLR